MTKDEPVVITTFIQKESHIKDMEVSLDTGIVFRRSRVLQGARSGMVKAKELIEILQKHCDPDGEVRLAYEGKVASVSVITKDDSGIILDVDDWLDLDAWWIDEFVVLWQRKRDKIEETKR